MPSCKVITTINLPTDDLTTSSDFNLILNGISNKKQDYILKKLLYKKSERKRSLKKIEKLSKNALTLFIEGKIVKDTYDEFNREAKYVLQQAIYLMKDEPRSPTGSDSINDYLLTGINSLTDILNP